VSDNCYSTIMSDYEFCTTTEEVLTMKNNAIKNQLYIEYMRQAIMETVIETKDECLLLGLYTICMELPSHPDSPTKQPSLE